MPQELCLMTLNGDAKFKGNLVNFDASTRKSENLHFDGLLLFKAYKVVDEKVQKSDTRFEEKLTLCSKSDMRSLVNFNVSSGKSENLHFGVTFVESMLCLRQKSTEELCVITLKNDAKFEEQLTCALKNDEKF